LRLTILQLFRDVVEPQKASYDPPSILPVMGRAWIHCGRYGWGQSTAVGERASWKWDLLRKPRAPAERSENSHRRKRQRRPSPNHS